MSKEHLIGRHVAAIPRRDRICFGSIRREVGKHLSDLLPFARRTGLLQPKPPLQLVGISREAFPVARFTPQDKTEQCGVESQHRRLEVFRNVKTLDPNAAEMPPQRAHLPPSDGRGTDDYRCQHNDRERHDSEPEAQGKLHAR